MYIRIASYSRSAPNVDPLCAGSHIGLDPYLDGVGPIRCRMGHGAYLLPIWVWQPSRRLRLYPHSLPNGRRIGFGPKCASAPFALAWTRFPIATECVLVCIWCQMGFSPLRSLVSALPVRCRLGIRPLWCDRWIRSQLASECVMVHIGSRMGFGPHCRHFSALPIRCRIGCNRSLL